MNDGEIFLSFYFSPLRSPHTKSAWLLNGENMFDAPSGPFEFPGSISTETFSSRLSIFVIILIIELFKNPYRILQLDRVRAR